MSLWQLRFYQCLIYILNQFNDKIIIIIITIIMIMIMIIIIITIIIIIITSNAMVRHSSIRLQKHYSYQKKLFLTTCLLDNNPELSFPQ